MYLLTKRIHDDGYKVVLSGEGSDEIFGGYLYFHYAPNEDEYHRELVRKVTRLH
jgi:asparagine synthase (glutamine-hydrolysing)